MFFREKIKLKKLVLTTAKKNESGIATFKYNFKKSARK